jgi:choice-of-anchor C domain-containing protein
VSVHAQDEKETTMRLSMRSSKRWVTGMVLLAVLAPGQALAEQASPLAGTNLVMDGSFENPSISNGTYYGGSHVGAWSVLSGSVDVTAAPYWYPANGTRSLDMSGFTAGAISQSVPTTPGAAYTLSFAAAANFNCAPTVKTLVVSWDGVAIATIHTTATGHTAQNMGWEPRSYQVTASSTSSVLQFSSETNTACGPVIDAVSVVAS